MEIILDDNYVLEYVQGNVPKPLMIASIAINSKYNKCDLKAKKFLIDGLQDHLLVYVGNLKSFKYIYDKLVGIYHVKNLNHILSLNNNLKELKINKGEFVQSSIMRVS